VARKAKVAVSAELASLARALDDYAGLYRELRGAADFGEYMASSKRIADEEMLTEPMLASILERVLGFGKGDYFAQRGKSGLKPDFTPIDLVTHRFVLDAKGSSESLPAHVAQIRRYVDQRALRHGVLFNGKHLRVYPAGSGTYDRSLSFDLVPLWRAARGEQLPVGPDFDAFERFLASFSHRALSTADKLDRIRSATSWTGRLGEAVVDVEFLVAQLRRLAGDLADDAGAQVTDLVTHVGMSSDRLQRLNDELRLIALDIEPSVDVDSLPDTVAGWSGGTATVARVWRQYLLRVAYLSVTRILLYRSWEDVGFVDEMLYDGGFDTAYERLNENVRDVLRRAFLLGSDKYKTLFSAENNYEWYRPSSDVLVDVLYNLGAIPLGKLDQDALGELYVSYVDEIDRDRLGQFFTPRDVVRFMLDRAGFSGEDVFRLEGDERLPLRVFDFATGSGGFLVEAARRVIEDSGIEPDDPRGLQEALRAISSGFYGGEISPFPYYLTEINLLLQVSRLLGRMRVAGAEPPPFVLGVMRIDSLETKSGLDVEAEQRAASAVVPAHDIYDVLPLEPEKHGKFRDLHRDGEFDLVIGNPPYVAEANNKTLFRHFRSLPQWNGIYRGKTDYLYYFLLLALEKLRPGGKLCVITPAGWMNAGTAEFLRARLAGELTLEELFLFGSYKLFAQDQGPAPTPTVESAILVATKAPPAPGHELRVVALEDESAAAGMSRAELLEEFAQRILPRGRSRRGVLVHSIRQSVLEPGYPWPVKFRTNGVHMRTVRHLRAALANATAPVEPIATAWSVFTGIETAADAYTARIRRSLPAEARRDLDLRGAEIGSPIMELPLVETGQKPWSDYPTYLARSPEPTAILYGAVDADDSVSYLLLERGSTPPPAVLAALEPWKAVLANRAEITRNRREWWETAWPRNPSELASPKVIALYRTDRGRFALDETGEWKPGKKSTVLVGRQTDAPVAYLCGLLNSELLDLWYAVRGKTPWHVRRNYEPLRMNEMPYRRPEGDPRADKVAELVREIAANRLALLPHRPFVRDLGRIVKDPWKSGPVEIDRAALVDSLPKREKVSVRLDRELTVTGSPAGKLRRERDDMLVLKRGRDETGRISGDAARLDLLAQIAGPSAEDAVALLLPKDLATFESVAAERARVVSALLDEGREKVERVERLVCVLYGLPDDLTDAVVQHAVARAAR
jgi:hypothetical protein